MGPTPNPLTPRRRRSRRSRSRRSIWWSISIIIAVVFQPSLGAIGVNWGSTASHPLPPEKVVELLSSNGISKVKLSDADPEALQALSAASPRVGVAVGIPNAMLRGLNSSRKAAESWVHDNVTRYFPSLKLEYVVVGDEPFHQSYGDQFRPFVIGAAMNIQAALTKAKLADQVKVVVPCSDDTFLSESGLPTKGSFRGDLNKTMIELLTFLTKHRSPFFVTISPFINFHQSKNVSLDFALFKASAHPRNDGRRTYKNSFDLSYDTLVTALSNLGFPDMDIVVSKIGWPTDGAVNGTSSTAESFMKGLMDHLGSKTGTPLRPWTPPLETYIFSLLDEDERSIVDGNFERHWGIFTFDGQAKYHLDFGRRLTNAVNVEYLPSRWCVLNNNKGMSNATASALDACSAADCSTLYPGGSCYNISWPGNISYAFNSYYQQHDQRADSCDFGGLGLITTVDPSMGNCRFPIQLRTSEASSVHVLISVLVITLFFLVANAKVY